MNIWIILIIAGMVAAIMFLSRRSEDEVTSRKRYLEGMAAFFEVALENSTGNNANYRIQFNYGGRNFIFEDVEDRYQEKEAFREGFLRTKTSSQLTLNFNERSRTTIRTDIKSIKDLKYGWAQLSKDVIMPKALEEFSVYTNNASLTAKLLEDEKMVNFFKASKSRGSRGHPVMPVEIKDGEILLKFYAPKVDLKPNLLDLQDNPTLIEEYVKSLQGLAGKIDSLQKEAELSGK